MLRIDDFPPLYFVARSHEQQEDSHRATLRPKQRRAQFYTLISKGTDEQRFGAKRQLFLAEQGYKYYDGAL
jgi:hypothetical protein